MCGIVGFFDPDHGVMADAGLVQAMSTKLVHRGPNSYGCFLDRGLGFGFRRLCIIGVNNGDQPLSNEDGSVVSICNGELYQYKEIRKQLKSKGHVFHTDTDAEILPHLYEEHDMDFLPGLNGQFALALYDRKKSTLFLARDHFGVNPLFYTFVGRTLVFASEIKAILEYPGVKWAVNITGLDQVLTFPGLVSPETMFEGIYSLKSGHYLQYSADGCEVREYWDVIYPRKEDIQKKHNETYYVERLVELLFRSTCNRLTADVPVGVYLSGGLDSSLVAALTRKLTPETSRHSFSISFKGKEMCEGEHQRRMAEAIGSEHHDVVFDGAEVASRLESVLYHTECPLKETYDTACMALSKTAKGSGVSVVLTGQGADEIFAGYIGYRFDTFNSNGHKTAQPLEEQRLREKLWGDPAVAYEGNYAKSKQTKALLYSDAVKALLPERDSCEKLTINKERIWGRHPIHQRSYLDLKLRLADHLLGDHGDRMTMANAVEGRHPFLDLELMKFAVDLPPEFHLKGFNEKYILKKAACPFLPAAIVEREKFGWYAPGSPALLRTQPTWVEEKISRDKIKKQGYFNPNYVEQLKSRYSQRGFMLNQPFESDLLLIVLTFTMFVEMFNMPYLS